MLILLTRYVSVGVINTLIHWITFAIGFTLLHFSQMLSNVVAFTIAVTFSFFANAKWTFRTHAGLVRYLAFTIFMGLVALTIGFLADKISCPPVLTLITFSSISLIIGFLFSNFVVFRNKS